MIVEALPNAGREHKQKRSAAQGEIIMSRKSKGSGSKTLFDRVNRAKRRWLKRILRRCVSAEMTTIGLCDPAQAAVR